MQTKITSYFIGVVLWSLSEARPQTFNNYPYRPTFSDLDQYNPYTTPMTYMQNSMQIWPKIVDQAVSPLYNLNQANTGYLGNTGYTSTVNNGYNTYPISGAGYINPSGYSTNSNGYYNSGVVGYPTILPYLSNTNPFALYNGKK